MNVFVENGYEQLQLTKVIGEVRKAYEETLKRTNEGNEDTDNTDENISTNEGNEDTDNTDENLSTNMVTKKQTISLPWIPKLSPKLRKAYKKAGYKVVFKSNSNLLQILTSKNKFKLREHSHPGIYKIRCSNHPDNPYIGETKMQIQTRVKQHEESVRKGRWDKSAISLHKMNCDGNIDWDEIETVKVERKTFDRKVREALEIQYNMCGPEKGGMNMDDGKYVTTKFWTPFFAYNRKRERKVQHTVRHTGNINDVGNQ